MYINIVENVSKIAHNVQKNNFTILLLLPGRCASGMYLREFGAELILDRVELALQAGDSSVHVRHRPRVGAMLVVDARLQVLAHL